MRIFLEVATEDAEVREVGVWFPCVLGLGITFPVDEMLDGAVGRDAGVEDALGHKDGVLTRRDGNGRCRCLKLAGMALGARGE